MYMYIYIIYIRLFIRNFIRNLVLGPQKNKKLLELVKTLILYMRNYFHYCSWNLVTFEIS